MTEIFKNIRGIAFDVDGVLSPSMVPLGADGVPQRMVNIKDGYALQHAAKCGLELAIISGARCEAVERRFAALGFQHIYMGAEHKLPVFRQWLAECGLSADAAAFVGDDVPDVPALHAAGLGVAPADAAPEAQHAATMVTQSCGGHGVARELVEKVLKAQGLWATEAKAFGW